MLNRCVVTVTAKEPFLDWLKGLPDPCDFGLDLVNGDNTIYLLPVYEDDQQRDRILRRYFLLIFEDQLAGWWTRECDWPSQRDLRTFKRWFDVEFHSVVHDLVAGSLLEDE
jgi:hypothetical protein